MKKTSLLFVLFALVLASDAGSTSVANAAEPSWKIRVDNLGNPDAPSYWGTNEDIEIYVCGMIGGTPCNRVGVIQGPTGIHAAIDIIVPSRIRSYANTGEIHFTTTGGDLFVIDQLRVFDETGTQRRRYGADSMKGYCLSTKASAINDPACQENAGTCWFNFRLDGVADGYDCP